MFIIGSFVVVNKFILQWIPVFAASEFRLFIASVVFVPVFLIKKQKLPKFSFRDAVILFLQSFVGVFMYSLCILYGLQRTSAIESGIILSTAPAIMALISWIFLKEKISHSKLAGITFIVTGTLSVNIAGILLSGEIAFRSLFGDLLILLAVISNAIFFLFGKLLTRWSPMAISMILSVIGAILFLPFSVTELSISKLQRIPLSIWILVLYTGVVVTVFAVYLMNRGVKYVPGNIASAFPALETISTTFLSWSILNEKIYWYHFLGIAFILFGIWVMTRGYNSIYEKDDVRGHI